MSEKNLKYSELDYNAIGERLKGIRATESQGSFGDKFGISQMDISRFERAEVRPSTEFLLNVHKVCGVSFNWLLFGEEEKGEKYGISIIKEDSADFGGFVFVPQVSGSISAGGGLIPDNSIELKIAFRKDWIERRGDPTKMSLIRVSGDSMEPTLMSGDLVLVDLARNYVDPQGGIYAIAFEQTIMIKRIQVLHPSKKIKVISDNTRYESIETETEQLRINGKVIWFGREIER